MSYSAANSAPVSPHTSPSRSYAKCGSRISCPGVIEGLMLRSPESHPSSPSSVLSPMRRFSFASPLPSPEKSPPKKVAMQSPDRGPMSRRKLSFTNLPPVSLLISRVAAIPQDPILQDTTQDPFVEALHAYNFDGLKKMLVGIDDKKILTCLQGKHKALTAGSEEEKCLARIIAYYRGLRNDLGEKKNKLVALDALKISLFVEKKLRNGPAPVEYVQENHAGIERALIFAGKNFYVLSGKHSAFQAKGEERKVANATQFCLAENNKLQSKQLVAIVNITKGRGYDECKQDVKKMRRQAELAQKINNDIHQVVSFTDSKGFQRIVVVEDKYEKTLSDFSLSVKLLHNVLKIVGQKLLWMHTHGYVHADIKEANILLDPLRIKLTDFGFTYNNTEDFPMDKALQTAYGTAEYTAPEFFPRKLEPWAILVLQAIQAHLL